MKGCPARPRAGLMGLLEKPFSQGREKEPPQKEFISLQLYLEKLIFI
jgi:hypothetical protein